MARTTPKDTKTVINCKALKSILNFKGLQYDHVIILEDRVDAYAHFSRTYGICPECGKRSHSVHSSYERPLASLPLHGKPLKIHLKTRRFRCGNKSCSHKYFSEQLPGVSTRYSRLTPCATERLTQLFLEVSACKGAYLSKTIGIPVSASTGLRILNRIQIEGPHLEEIRHICLDDFSYRKGVSYGTMIIDSLTHSVLEVFEGRSHEEAAAVLESFPNLETVSRDRAGAYAKAVTEACPGARQIADRFHILKNISEYIAEQIKTSRRAIRDEAMTTFPSGVPLMEKERQESEAVRGRSYFNRIKGLLESGVSVERICQKHHYQSSVVQECLKEIRRHEPEGQRRRIDKILRNRKLKLYVTNPYYGVDGKTGDCSEEHIRMNQIIDASPTLLKLRMAYTSFRSIFTDKDEGKLDAWLELNERSPLKKISDFAAGIRRDFEAVRNAITHDISNGPIEGMNNKLKVIKRAMYGRAGYRLLMIKMRLSKTG